MIVAALIQGPGTVWLNPPANPVQTPSSPAPTQSGPGQTPSSRQTPPEPVQTTPNSVQTPSRTVPAQRGLGDFDTASPPQSIREGSAPAPSHESTQGATAGRAGAGPTISIESRGVRFDLSGCSRSSSEVVCLLSITNLRAERDVMFIGRSDGFGNSFALTGGAKYLPSQIGIGNRTINGGMTETFVQGEPFSASIRFSSVSIDAVRFSTLSLRFMIHHDEFDVRFPNVTIID